MPKYLVLQRSQTRKSPPSPSKPPLETLRTRLPNVHAVLYLLFNEGYDKETVTRLATWSPDRAARRATQVSSTRLQTPQSSA